MKKKLICFAMAMMLILSSSVTAFASDQSAYLDPSSGLPLGPTGSLQLMYAQLQMAGAAKQQAEDAMEQIAEMQEEQRQISAFLNTARQCWSEAESTGAVTEMPADMAEYMDDNGLSYDTTGDDLLMTAEEWDVAIISLEHRLEELSMEVQQQMAYFYTCMAQYNSCVEEANNLIPDPQDPDPQNPDTQNPDTQNPYTGQTLTSLARGQSMYGDSEVGLAVTGLVLGLVLGCAATLAVQKVRRKKDAV